jgi:hypothetical protein
MERRTGATGVDVVAVKGDIESPERDLPARELRDQAAETLCQGDASRVDADERGAVEVGVPLDDLVRDAGDGAPERLSVQDELLRLCGRSHHRLLSGLTGPS